MSADPTGDVTLLLKALGAGDPSAANKLFPLLYEELQRIAQRCLNRERADHTLQSTALVHEAYLRIIGQEGTTWQNRSHFTAVAAQAMRRILIDHARARKAGKRGGEWERVALEDVFAESHDRDGDLIALNDALERLGTDMPSHARVVEMRFFAGMQMEEIAEVLGITDRTARRYWSFAKAWLYKEMTRDDSRFLESPSTPQTGDVELK